MTRLFGRRRLLRGLVLAGALGFVLLNVLAYRHAQAMTRFLPRGHRTPPPEALTWGDKLGLVWSGAAIPRPPNRWTPRDVGLPFEPHRFTTADGLALEGWHVPHPRSGGLVLLFHGYADAKAALLPEAKAFHAMGFAAFLVDFRGSGGSMGERTSIGYHEAEDVAAALDFARRLEGRPAHVLFGASMGAAAVLRAAAEKGARPRAVILESPFDRLIHAVTHRFSALGVPAFPAAPLLVFWGGVQQGFPGFRHDPIDYAPRVGAPALLLAGERDERVTLAEARAVFERLPAGKVFVTFPGAGHGSLLKADPFRWRDAVARFLDGVGGLGPLPPH